MARPRKTAEPAPVQEQTPAPEPVEEAAAPVQEQTPAPEPVEEAPAPVQEQTLAPADDGLIAVETTGPFMLIDITTGVEISHEGVTRVPPSSFIMMKIESGQLKQVG